MIIFVDVAEVCAGADVRMLCVVDLVDVVVVDIDVVVVVVVVVVLSMK